MHIQPAPGISQAPLEGAYLAPAICRPNCPGALRTAATRFAAGAWPGGSRNSAKRSAGASAAARDRAPVLDGDPEAAVYTAVPDTVKASATAASAT
jgi:hypothetical protein